MSGFEAAVKEKFPRVSDFKVAAMPDFFLDYVLGFPGKLEDLAGVMIRVAEKGGGNILGWKHMIGRGGNASNFSAQLAKLGVDVVPVIETDELGKGILTQSLKDADLSHVRG